MLVAAFAATIMMPLCAISVDVARWYVEISRIQNAADAAATAGVTFLPDDFASAKSTAITVAGRNGFPNSGTTSVSVSIGDKPTQLQVTISSNVGNAFGASFGVKSATIVRSATADFNGPAPMGSPCNTFGNEPQGAVSDATDPIRGPNTSVIVAPPGGAQCTSNPQFWGAVAGPDTNKQSGDQYMTRSCTSAADGCTGTVNDEFDPRGYFYIVRVTAAAVNKSVTLQIYDPAWVDNGDTCTQTGPKASTKPNNIPFRDPMSTYTPTDGIARYNPSPNEYCTGDTLGGGTTPITTSYGLRVAHRHLPAEQRRADHGLRTPVRRHHPVHGKQHHPGRRVDRHPGAVPRQVQRHHASRTRSSRTPSTTPSSRRSTTSGWRCAPSPRPRSATTTSRSAPT